MVPEFEHSDHGRAWRLYNVSERERERVFLILDRLDLAPPLKSENHVQLVQLWQEEGEQQCRPFFAPSYYLDISRIFWWTSLATSGPLRFR